jgi:hypothetical protein
MGATSAGTIIRTGAGRPTLRFKERMGRLIGAHKSEIAFIKNTGW